MIESRDIVPPLSSGYELRDSDSNSYFCVPAELAFPALEQQRSITLHAQTVAMLRHAFEFEGARVHTSVSSRCGSVATPVKKKVSSSLRSGSASALLFSMARAAS